MVCGRCGSNNVSIQMIAQRKKRGCLASLLWIGAAVCTCGLILLIPLLIRKGDKIRKYIVCNDCGYTRTT